MYRIRRLTGGEVNLASLDELAAAIAAGAVTADAEIYHQRADRWLPIANHPHFRIAKDRSQSPARKPTPVPSPVAGMSTQPALRLMRSDMNAATPSSEARPVSRWTPPQRAMGTAPRSSGSAAPAIEPTVSHVVEFVAETPAVAPTPAPVDPPRPKRVEQATVGLPLLDIDMPEPPRAIRQPTPMPSPAKQQMPLALPEPGPMPIAARQPTPMPSPATWPTMQSAPRTAPRLERTPVSAPLRQPTPAPVPVRVPTPAPVAVAAPMPWAPPAVEPSLDLPPAVTDFSAPEEAPAIETELAGVAAEPGSRASSRWPMVAGAVVLMAAAAFLALRPRADVDSLEPMPVAAAPAALPTPSTTGASMGYAASARPQITPIVPPGPSLELAEERLQPIEQTVVPAAPKLTGAVPESALRNVGAIDVPMDPTVEQRHRALEETRRQIESQMQR